MQARGVYLRGAATAGAVALLVVTVFAIHIEGLFELGDGTDAAGTADIEESDVQPGCDWETLFADLDPAAVAAAVEQCGGVDATFVVDDLGQGGSKDDTVFTQGSSKNNDPVSDWEWTTGGVPAKDDLSNVYALATLNDADELIVYAGVERLAPNGDSHLDIELNQVPIELDREPPCEDDGSAGPGDGSPCEFEGERSVGDILLVVDFKKGGDLSLVEIHRWDGTEYAEVDTLGGEGCNAADTVCAFNNGQTIDGGPWPNFDSKGQEIASLPRNAFTEVGLNVTALLGRTPCFANVTAKSRTSASFNSSLKDFVKTDLEICSLSIEKDGDSPNNPNPTLTKGGDEFYFHYEIANTGGAPLYLVSVIDSFLGDITEFARGGGPEGADFGCDVLSPSGSCDFQVPAAIPDGADDPFDSSVEATFTDQPSGLAPEVLITVSASDTLSLNLFQPAVDVEKTGDALSTPGNVVNYTITVTDTSSEDSPGLENGLITDDLLGDLLDPDNPYVTGSTCNDTLATGASCTITAARTVQPDDPAALVNTVSVSYNPVGGFPNVIADSDSHTTTVVFPDASLSLEVTPSAATEGDTVTYTSVISNTGDVTLLLVSAVSSLQGDLADRFPAVVAPGESVTVVTMHTIGPDDPDPLVNTITVVYRIEGLPDTIERSATASVDIIVPCALSPGFWKGGSGVPKWDNLLEDPIAQAAGFDTGTVFPWLDPGLAGTTYLGVLDLPAQGDVTRQLSFKYIAARLNEATFGVPQSTAVLLNTIDLYLAQHPVGSLPSGAAEAEGQALLGSLNRYFSEVGEGSCPPPDEF